MEDETRIILENHEGRLKRIEDTLFHSKGGNVAPKGSYKGLAGGIRFIIDSGFLKQPKSLGEIMGELKREGYHHSKPGVASTLSETFTKNQKILNRIREDKAWKYVLRK